MAQRIVTLCDVHQHADEETPGVQWTISVHVPGERPVTWEVDLCEDDSKGLRDLAALLDEVGRVVDGPRKRRGSKTAAARVEAPGRSGGLVEQVDAPHTDEGYPCPKCEKVPRTRKGLMSHLKTYHDGMSLAEALGQPLPYVCPECGRKFSHGTGMGAHRRAIHGVPAGGSEGDG